METDPIRTTRTWSPYFSPNQGHGALPSRLLKRHFLNSNRKRLQNPRIDLIFHRREFILCQSGKMGEIKTHPVGIYELSSLLDMRTKYLTQGGLKQMRGGMISHGG